MESGDSTTDIVKEFTPLLYTHPNLGYADPARAVALSKATKDWVLIVDADEVLEPELWEKLEEIITQDVYDVVVIPFRTWMFGREIQGGGWGPGQDWHERFFRRSVNILSDQVHEMFRVPPHAKVLRLPYPGPSILHFNYLDLEHFFDKFNRYTTIEAQNRFEGLKPGFRTFGKALLKSLKTFVRRFFILKGFRDKGLGFLLALSMALYYLVVWYKELLMNSYADLEPREKIRSSYEKVKSRTNARV